MNKDWPNIVQDPNAVNEDWCHIVQDWMQLLKIGANLYKIGTKFTRLHFFHFLVALETSKGGLTSLVS